ncbi:hypothetical protein TRIP_B250067 [uncultured Desulfatiglans sp.]|uniref:Uncharacterized protein n=1 Tax=Uncultured Desulfatiglans sp. TaxID=1748965 RepID=A0A653A4I6_UNCDX|nr:hypothetical protein TRIP_B250067 [uncultured Desulfatiglans sp.]
MGCRMGADRPQGPGTEQATAPRMVPDRAPVTAPDPRARDAEVNPSGGRIGQFIKTEDESKGEQDDEEVLDRQCGGIGGAFDERRGEYRCKRI